MIKLLKSTIQGVNGEEFSKTHVPAIIAFQLALTCQCICEPGFSSQVQ